LRAILKKRLTFINPFLAETLHLVFRFKDMPMEGVNIPKEDENKIMHISLQVGKDNVLMATDSLESLGMKLTQGNNVYISVHPESKEEADRIFNALSRWRHDRDANRRSGVGRLLWQF